MSKILEILASGFEEIEAVAPADIWRRLGIEVTLAGLDDMQITGAHGMTLQCDALLEEVSELDFDGVFLPGGMPGVTNLQANKNVVNAVQDFAKNDKYVCAICAAPLVFGNRGLLNGKKATCYPGFETYLQGADYTAALVEKDGNFITAKGPGAALEFAFAIVEKYCGCQMVNELKHGMMIQA